MCVYIDESSASESCSKVPAGEVCYALQEGTDIRALCNFCPKNDDREQTKLVAVLYYCGK